MRANLDIAVGPSECIFEQITGHFVEILLLACNREIGRHVQHKSNFFVRINLA